MVADKAAIACDPIRSVRAYPFAIAASITLWLLALILLALAFRMEGRSLRHAVQHHAHSAIMWSGAQSLLPRILRPQ